MRTVVQMRTSKHDWWNVHHDPKCEQSDSNHQRLTNFHTQSIDAFTMFSLSSTCLLLAGDAADRGNNSGLLVLTTIAATALVAVATVSGYSIYLYHHHNQNKNEKQPPSSHQKKDRVVISGLTHPRGSAGMNLPSSLSPKTIEIVAATAPVVAPKALDITKSFYHTMLGKHSELLGFFNPAHNVPISLHQPKALAGSIVAYASNIQNLAPLLVKGGAVEAIAHRHVALSVYPAQYVIVYENVMQAIAKILGDAVTEEIATAWSEAVLFLAKVLIDVEESVYQTLEQRRGGWSGPIEFQVTKMVDIANNVKSITLMPPPDSPLYGSNFDFEPGQYVSLNPFARGVLSAPRHYAVTSPIGANYFECSIKKLPGGKVSTYVHEHLKVGDLVQLTAPCGVFTVPLEKNQQPASAVLMSAGVGATQMVNIARTLGDDRVKLVTQVDKNPEDYPFRDFFGRFPRIETFTSGLAVRPTAADLAQQVVAKVGLNHTFFMCGPEAWMEELQAELLRLGVYRVKCSVMGSQLATSCPFQASGSSAVACPFMKS
jgi:nitric oxide dioxygenase